MYLNREKNYEKKYKRIRLALLISLIFCGAIIYLNFDYFVFKILIAGNYAYTDALDSLYYETMGDAKGKGYFKNFDDVAIAVFSQRLNDRYTYLYTPEQYTYQKENIKYEGSFAEITPISTEAVYLYLPNISDVTRKFVFDNKEEIKKYKDIVIDLRGNRGGGLSDLYKIADLFLEKGSIISTEVARNRIFTKTIKAKEPQYLKFEKIIILQDGNTASSAEGLIMALAENLDNVQIVGTQSFGKGIGQIELPIKYGFAIRATVIRLTTPDNNSIHLKGITPDVYYDGDNVLELVEELLIAPNY